MKIWTFFLLALLSSVSIAQEVSRDLPTNDRTPDFKLRVFLDLLGKPDLVAELEIVESQKLEIGKVGEEYITACDKVFEDFHSQSATSEAIADASAREEMRTVANNAMHASHKKLGQEALESLDRILLPHQMKRLNQLVVQKLLLVEYRGDLFGLFAGVAKRLNISPKDNAKFKERLSELKQEYEQKIKELQNKLRKDVMDKLPEGARSEFTQLIGEIYRAR
ncbi:hypothetical protein [Mariniblastus fucicola]|uniref:Uncharacterized protein n=1 Tax=Mariniblastus fucicola TaxID=980251 RepID=A0A5B9PDX9_9BACT|nr:hypothetical protein [Mariniblastus fucicola]QEG22776.1 hypothetical protein MFFC18_26590 [Mariniblastus fucicola]